VVDEILLCNNEQIKYLENKLDKLVCQLYGLTDEEIKIIEEIKSPKGLNLNNHGLSPVVQMPQQNQPRKGVE
jgi:hypothetical protein